MAFNVAGKDAKVQIDGIDNAMDIANNGMAMIQPPGNGAYVLRAKEAESGGELQINGQNELKVDGASKVDKAVIHNEGN